MKTSPHQLAQTLQPDQSPAAWNDHVSLYEAIFEPVSIQFAVAALDALGPIVGKRLADIGAGAGGASLEAARRGARVTAIDASATMTARVESRAAAGKLDVTAIEMDAGALAFRDGAFDLGLSVFGLILMPDAAQGARELRRVLAPGGRAAIVTWTQPHRFELSARLRAATAATLGEVPQGPLPAQLRYREPADFHSLLEQAGFVVEKIEPVVAAMRAPSARWLGERLAFAPGMAAMLDSLGAQKEAVVDAFIEKLESDQGGGPVTLGAIAQVAIARNQSHA